jgi:hypothetical protein
VTGSQVSAATFPVLLPGLNGHYHDPDGDVLLVTTSPFLHGSLANGTGIYTGLGYTPDSGFVGIDYTEPKLNDVTSNSSNYLIGKCRITIVVGRARDAAPAAPTGVSAVASGPAIDLHWTDASSTETCFKVFRQTGAGSFIYIGKAIGNATTYTDTAILPSTTYSYKVLAYRDTAGDSSDSNTATATSTASASMAGNHAPVLEDLTGDSPSRGVTAGGGTTTAGTTTGGTTTGGPTGAEGYGDNKLHKNSCGIGGGPSALAIMLLSLVRARRGRWN